MSFSRAGMQPAWRGGSLSRSYSRSRSPSASNASSAFGRPSWGGEELDQDRQSECSTLPVRLTHLPWNNDDEDLERVYVAFVRNGEIGSAMEYSRVHKEDIKTRKLGKVVTVVKYDSEVGLWRELNLDPWMLSVHQWIREQIDILYDRMKERMQTTKDTLTGDLLKATVKQWTVHLNQVNMFLRSLGKVVTMRNIIEAVRIQLQDEAFFASLNFDRISISFRNGVLDLSTGVLTPRTRDHKLTYALDYDYVADIDTSRMQSFVESCVGASAARNMQRVMGYTITGLVEQKTFFQLSAPKDHGKTVLLEIAVSVLGKDVLARMNKIPVAEFCSGSGFEHSLGRELMSTIPVRLIATDEINNHTRLNEAFINSLTCGIESSTVACRMKGDGAVSPVWHGKLWFSTNHTLSIEASSVGTIGRLCGPPFPFEFIAPHKWDPLAAKPHQRKADVAAKDFLCNEGRSVAMRWMVEGAIEYFTNGRALVLDSSWDISTFHLRTDGDEYARWIIAKYHPTGNVSDLVETADMLRWYRLDHPTSRRDHESGIKASLASFYPYIQEHNWTRSAMVTSSVAQPALLRVYGYQGLRIRLDSDPSWASCIAEATRLAVDARRAINAAAVVVD